MDDNNKKCSLEEHKEKDANFYCIQCRVNMCNKCESFHSKLCKKHKVLPLDKNIDEIFTGCCKEKNHNNNILDYFCKTHNQLCCAECISKIKNENIGTHHDCEIDILENIKEEKINILKDNIKFLEYLSNNIINSIKELKEIFEKNNKCKEELKLKISKIFTEIRNQLNKREDELFLEIDKTCDEFYVQEELIKESEKLPNKIRINIEKGKKLIETNINNNLNYVINDCLNIENITKDITTINNNIEKRKESININIEFNNDKEKEMNDIIKLFGKIELQNDYLYKDFNIQYKQPIHKLKFHTQYLHSLTVLNDGRLVSGSNDWSIIIYNKLTYEPDLTIKEHNESVCYVIQLSSGELVTCSKDLIIFKIRGLQYEVLQRIKIITNKEYEVLKLIELKNKNLVSCSNDSSIIFYNKEDLKYKIKDKIYSNGGCYSIIQTKENELCYSEGNNNKICFYNFIEKKIK